MSVRSQCTKSVSRMIATRGPSAYRVIVALALVSAAISTQVGTRAEQGPAVHPLFDLLTPLGGPFPSDRFTVADPAQATGRRVALPYPADCVASRSDCDDISVLNELDGFNQHPRVSIPFDGDIDPATVTRDTIFILSVPDFDNETLADRPAVSVIGLNQIVWDPETRTLHARSDDALEEHTRYALVVTRGVLDASGQPIHPSDRFANYRHLLAISGDEVLIWYRDELIRAEHAARVAGVGRGDLAVISPFHTQSSTYMARRIHDDIFASPPPPPADFNIGPDGSRAVYPLASLSSVTFNQQTTTGPTLSPAPGFLTLLRFVPGAIDRVAFGRYDSPRYRVDPDGHIPAVPTLTGTPARQGSETIYFNLYLPSGPMPEGGWPVAIVGHGSSAHKNFLQGTDTSVLASQGVAWLMINTAGHGFGPRSTLQLGFTDGTSVGVPAGGRSADHNGDGRITVNEGFQSRGRYAVRDLSDGYLQTAADLMQLVRVIQTGVDVDGDGPYRSGQLARDLLGLVAGVELRHDVLCGDARGAGRRLCNDRLTHRRAPSPQHRGAAGRRDDARRAHALAAQYRARTHFDRRCAGRGAVVQ